MHVSTLRLRPISLLPLLIGLVAAPASAAIDVTGNWLFGYDSTQFGYVDEVVTLSQSGATLSIPTQGFTGTIDPDTGVFSLSVLRHCATLENPIGWDVPATMDGTFTADSNGMTGTFYTIFRSGRACYEASGALYGMRLIATTTVTTTSSSTITTFSTIATTSTTSTSTSTIATPSTTSTTLPSTLLTLRTLKLTDPAATSRRRLVLDSRDGHVGTGLGDGSVDDPTLHGGALRVRTPDSDVTYDLPAANWTRTPSGGVSGYRYRDTRQSAGPITAVDVKPGRQLKAVGKGAGLGTTLDDDPRPVRVVVRLGGQQLCLEAGQGGTHAFKAGKFTARGADAPIHCLAP